MYISFAKFYSNVASFLINENSHQVSAAFLPMFSNSIHCTCRSIFSGHNAWLIGSLSYYPEFQFYFQSRVELSFQDFSYMSFYTNNYFWAIREVCQVCGRHVLEQDFEILNFRLLISFLTSEVSRIILIVYFLIVCNFQFLNFKSE